MKTPGVLGHLKNLQLPFLRRLKSLDPSLHFTHELLRPRTLWWAQARDRDPLPAALAHSEGAQLLKDFLKPLNREFSKPLNREFSKPLNREFLKPLNREFLKPLNREFSETPQSGIF